ncbi:MAG: class I SAM-dependent methyltransferase [Clostridiaceae bacterium]|nr:class I SAM-dependent methyltransferase [Clostridiaceae bacterium]
MNDHAQNITSELLFSLWARAAETKRNNPVVRDEYAVELIRWLGLEHAPFPGTPTEQLDIAIRTRIIDTITRAFIANNPTAIIIACRVGLDTRFQRVDNGLICWYNVDQPRIVQLRQKLFPTMKRVHYVPIPVTAPEWCRAIRTDNRPVLIILEQTSMYLERKELISLLDNIASAFPGSTLIMDAITTQEMRRRRKQNRNRPDAAELKWAARNVDSIVALNSEYVMVNEWIVNRWHRDRLSFWQRIRTSLPWRKNQGSLIVLMRYPENVNLPEEETEEDETASAGPDE